VTRTRPRRLIPLVAVLLALGLAACGSGMNAASQKWYQAGDGTNVDAGDIEIRGVVVVSDGSGSATVLAAFSNPTGEPEQVTSISVGGQPADLAGPIVVPAKGRVTTVDDGRRIVATGTDATPGLLVPVTFTFATAPEAATRTVVQEPVGAYTDYAPPPPAPTPTGSPVAETPTPTPTGG
jgi:hypothetical protein